MSSIFLLVEGVNIYEHLYDTDQLSVIRGSSFLYKGAIVALESAFANQLAPISTGASSGLFQLKHGIDGDSVAAEIRTFLAADTDVKGNAQHYHFLSFGVVHCQADTLSEAKARLLSLLRTQQLQSFTVTPDHAGSKVIDQLSGDVCALSGVSIQAADRKSTVQSDASIPLSASIYHRLRFGRDQKTEYYNALINDEVLIQALEREFDFAGDLEDLCTDESQKLNHKMAVIYIDGNQFGGHQRVYIEQHDTLAAQLEAQQTFDVNIQNQRATFLESELKRLLKETDSVARLIRFETLMWGGDEMLLVMPAWEAYAFMQRFFTTQWQLGNTPLTHAAGVVFCQASTPIRIVQKLAHDLAEGVKNTEGGRDKNGWDYLVLESVDYPTNESLGKYFEERYGKALASARTPSLPSLPKHTSTDELAEMKQFFEQGAVTRSQLYRIVQSLAGSADDLSNDSYQSWQALLESDVTTVQELSAFMQAEYRLYQVSPDKTLIKDKLPILASTWFGVEMNHPKQRAWFWMHLNELWDYLVPQVKTGDVQ